MKNVRKSSRFAKSNQNRFTPDRGCIERMYLSSHFKFRYAHFTRCRKMSRLILLPIMLCPLFVDTHNVRTISIA